MQLPSSTLPAMSAQSTTSLTRQELNAWRGLIATHSALIAKLDEELEREHGLPLTSYEVLLLSLIHI